MSLLQCSQLLLSSTPMLLLQWLQQWLLLLWLQQWLLLLCHTPTLWLMLLPTQAVSTVWGLLSPVPRTQTKILHTGLHWTTQGEQQYNNTIAQYYNITTLQYYNITNYNTTISQHYNTTKSQHYINTTFTNTSVQDCNCTSWQQRRQEYEGLQN